MSKNIKNVGNFEVIKKYEELSPCEMRSRIASDKCSSFKSKMDSLADQLYELNCKGKKLAKQGSLVALELKAAVFGGLIEDDIRKFDEISKEVENES